MTDGELGTVTNSAGRTLFFDPRDSRGLSLSAKGGAVYPLSLKLWNLAVGLQHWDAVVDVGANYGEMLAGADLSTAGQVFAFEPNAHVAAFLRRTIGNLPWDVELRELAVGREPRDGVVLAVDTKWSGKSFVASDADRTTRDDRHRFVTVPQTTLTEQFAESSARSVCIKVDVEGHERDVLDGAKGLFDAAERVAVMFEILHMPVHTIAEIGRSAPLYLLTRDGSALVRWEGRSMLDLGRQLYSGDYYRQDALILAGTDVDAFDREVSAACPPRLPDLPSRLAQATKELTVLRKELASVQQDRSRLEHEASELRKKLGSAQSSLSNAKSQLHDIRTSRSFRFARRVSGAMRRVIPRREP